MLRRLLFLSLVCVLIAAPTIPAVAADSVYFRNSTVSDTSKVLSRLDNSLGDIAFRDNPTLVTLDRPCVFLFDDYYLTYE